MSAMNKSNNTKFNNTKNTIKPHCAVCQSAGKPEEVYTSHFVRESPDPKSKVICPTLLSQKCLHCGNQGHTTSYCSLKKKTRKGSKKGKLQARNQGKRCADNSKEENNKCI